ncbi:sec-independent protein translocase protein TatB [Candidatus Electrothrix marina]|uniref:Sec-independent protein translocase protein TatB n=1 Tax=Candidatus Electrothrix marina TaxID=1859130 RepID=A0A444JHJ4_9BACT|nr:sec-independent protein translocase protein TatB [Candidatus Electrothrix marina]
MFGIGLPEMIVILAVALIVVGPDKLPELARSLAKGVNELKNIMNQVKESLNEETKIVSSVQHDLQQTAGQMKTHLLEDVTRNPNQWKQEGEVAPASDIVEGDEAIEVEIESLAPRSWEEETAPVLQKGSISDQQTEVIEGGADNKPEQHEAESNNTPDDDTSALRPSSVA